MENLVTPNGKEIKIINAPGTGHYKIIFGSGGELPQDLQGLFTSVFSAQRAVQKYLDLQQTKVKSRNG